MTTDLVVSLESLGKKNETDSNQKQNTVELVCFVIGVAILTAISAIAFAPVLFVSLVIVSAVYVVVLPVAVPCGIIIACCTSSKPIEGNDNGALSPIYILLLILVSCYILALSIAQLLNICVGLTLLLSLRFDPVDVYFMVSTALSTFTFAILADAYDREYFSNSSNSSTSDSDNVKHVSIPVDSGPKYTAVIDNV